jgi:hypothetical protein
LGAHQTLVSVTAAVAVVGREGLVLGQLAVDQVDEEPPEARQVVRLKERKVSVGTGSPWERAGNRGPGLSQQTRKRQNQRGGGKRQADKEAEAGRPIEEEH